MAVDESAFLRREWTGLFQNGVGHSNLTNVMQQRGYLDLIKALFRNLHLTSYSKRPFRQSSAVYPSVDVLQVEHLVEGTHERVAESEMLLFQFLDAQHKPRHIHYRIRGCRHVVAGSLSTYPFTRDCTPVVPYTYPAVRTRGSDCRCSQHSPSQGERSSLGSCC